MADFVFYSTTTARAELSGHRMKHQWIRTEEGYRMRPLPEPGDFWFASNFRLFEIQDGGFNLRCSSTARAED